MKAKQKELMIHQLVALRSTVDAVLSLLLDEEGDGMCSHPANMRENLTVMGGPNRFQCRACGEVVEG